MAGLRYGCRRTRAAVVVAMLIATLVLQVQVLQAQDIFVGFYDQSCPQAESIVTGTVREFNSRDPTTPAALLRLLFHDCFVEVHISPFDLHSKLLTQIHVAFRHTLAIKTLCLPTGHFLLCVCNFILHTATGCICHGIVLYTASLLLSKGHTSRYTSLCLRLEWRWC